MKKETKKKIKESKTDPSLFIDIGESVFNITLPFIVVVFLLNNIQFTGKEIVDFSLAVSILGLGGYFFYTQLEKLIDTMDRSKKKNSKKINWIIFMALALICSIFIASFLVFGHLSVSKQSLKNPEIIIPANLTGTYWTNDSVIVKFDTRDYRQVELVKQLEVVCRENGFRPCMNAKDLLIPNAQTSIR